MKKKVRTIQIILSVILIISGLGFPLCFSLLNTSMNPNLHADAFMQGTNPDQKNAISVSFLKIMLSGLEEKSSLMPFLLANRPDSLIYEQLVSLIIPQDWTTEQYKKILYQADAFIRGRTNKFEIEFDTQPVKLHVSRLSIEHVLEMINKYPLCPIIENQTDLTGSPVCIEGDFQSWSANYLANLESDLSMIADSVNISMQEKEIGLLREFRANFFISAGLSLTWIVINLLVLIITGVRKVSSYNRILLETIISGVFGIALFVFLLILGFDHIPPYSLFQSINVSPFNMHVDVALSKFIGYQFLINFMLICIVQIAIGIIIIWGIRIIRKKNTAEKVIPD